ncbi:MAG: hypothetical protein JW812_02135 [Alphaproteobacteria bacterium]|nr:hypothetical protein [Alphaproteobacteria bacterium]MBN2779570.1 hypothetical protein [Alphaproteobacteria bacterium]
MNSRLWLVSGKETKEQKINLNVLLPVLKTSTDILESLDGLPLAKLNVEMSSDCFLYCSFNEDGTIEISSTLKEEEIEEIKKKGTIFSGAVAEDTYMKLDGNGYSVSDIPENDKLSRWVHSTEFSLLIKKGKWIDLCLLDTDPKVLTTEKRKINWMKIHLK